MVCESCGEVQRANLRFCEACGHAHQLACPSCGSKGPSGRKFCGDCGVEIAGRPASSEADTATDVLNHDRLAGGERRHLTVMFCDLVGSTSLSQQLDAEDLSELVQQWSDSASAAIREHGGYVARFMGDGILSYFGFPKAFEDNADRSVRAAHAVVAATRSVGKSRAIDIQCRVGIASGDTVTGHSAQADAGVETLAIGQTPNLAARLEGIARPNTIVVSESTRALLKSGWLCEDLGPQKLKGFDQPAGAWLVGDRGPVAEVDDSRLSTFVSRDDELQELTRLWDRARTSCGQVMHLSGEAGIGKSTLATRFVSALRDVQTIRLSCRAAREGRAFGPVIDHFVALAAAANVDGTDTDAQRQLLRLNLPARICDDADALEVLFNLVFGNSEVAAGITASDRRGMLLTTITLWITESCADSPLLVQIEDLHWSDASTLDWIEYLAQVTMSLPIMLLVTSRPETSMRWEPAAHLHTMQLGRLNADSIGAITRALADGKPLPPDVLDLIIRRTDGIPLFVEELTRQLLASNALVKEEDGWRLTGDADDLTVPGSLQDLLMARLDKTPRIREIAQVAAVIGRRFVQSELSWIGQFEDADVASALSSLESDNLIKRVEFDGDRWMFRHALVRDAAYNSLLRAHKSALHARCAAFIESAYAQIAETEPERLAWHLAHAGENLRAAVLWQHAADNARHSWANKEACDYLLLAIKNLEKVSDTEEIRQKRLDLQIELGQVTRLASGSSSGEVLSAFTLAETLARETEDERRLCLALYGKFIAHFTAAQLDEAGDVSKQLQTVATRLGTAEALVASAQARGMNAFAVGRFDVARQALSEALDEGATQAVTEDIQFPVLAQSYLCWTLHTMGEEHAALDLFNESLDAARAGPGYHFALLLGNGCSFHQMRGDTESVSVLARELVSVAEQRHLPAWLDVANFFRAYAASSSNPSREELDRLSHALQAWAVDEIETPYFKCIVADRLLAAGHVDSALRLAREARSLMNETGEIWYLAQCDALIKRMTEEEKHAVAH